MHAQQARRFLDRVVGFEVSPLPWAKVARGLQAGCNGRGASDCGAGAGDPRIRARGILGSPRAIKSVDIEPVRFMVTTGAARSLSQKSG